MRHEQLRERDGFDIRDVAEIWGKGDGPTGPLSEVEAGIPARATPAVPDMPVAIGSMIAGVYAALILAFFLTMAGTREAAFMIVVSGFYVAMFLGVPRLFLHVEGDRSRRPSLQRFMARGINTYTGHMSGASALIQILVVPVLLTLAILAMGITGLVLL